MTARHSPIRFLNFAISAALIGGCFLPALHADPTQAPAAGDAVQQPYYGVLNQDNVYVRSGPSDVFYATTKLNKGAKVTVVAVRDAWLKIVPPDGSFCYLARAYVEKRGDGSVGRVTKAELNVRAGSMLNGLKTTVLTSLSEGDDVKILGEQEEYFKIAPPPGAYLYIMKTYVDALPAGSDQPVVASAKSGEPIASAPIPSAITPPPGAIPTAPVATPATPVTPIAAPPVTPVQPASTVAPVTTALAAASNNSVKNTAVNLPAGATPTTRPAVASSSVPATQPAVAAAPATQPAEPSADARFDGLESDFLAATGLPIDQQPLAELLKGYTAISTDPGLPASMRRITEMRIATIKLRSDAQRQYADAEKFDTQAKARELALKAEHQELVQKVKDQTVSIYTALGTLRVSSLQQSGTTMYRLTDPGTGRTLVYIKSNDAKYSDLLNQFVGVNGDINEDSNLNLKVLTPTGVDTVDQAKVNATVTATVMPPSLLPKTASAAQ